jgi:DNA-binding response OmpR family regulator
MAKILIVEDDLNLYTIYNTEFELSGHETIRNEDGAGVIEQVIANKPDIVLLDIMLPKKDGLTILEELKQNPATKDTPAIILTNFGNEENVKKAIDTGAEDFILKYKSVPSEVVAKTAEILERKQSHGKS